MCKSKRWSIIGAGNGGQAFAAYFSIMGIDVALYDTFQKTVDQLNELGGVQLEGHGKKSGFGKIAFASTDMEKVLDGAEVIWVILPSLYHKGIAEKMAPYLKDGQTVILSPVAALGTMEFEKVLKDNGCTADITLAGTCTLLFACRMNSVGHVTINGQKEYVTIAAYPSSRNDQVKALINEYVPEMEFVSSILQVFFDNVNFEFHPGPTMLYSAMIESGIDFDYYTDFCPAQIKLIEAMDKERMALCKAYHIDQAKDALEIFTTMYNYEDTDLLHVIKNADCYKGIHGPKSLRVRYLQEDVPYALKGIQTLAKIAKVETPVIDTVVSLAYILLGDELDAGRSATSVGIPTDATLTDMLSLCNGKQFS